MNKLFAFAAGTGAGAALVLWLKRSRPSPADRQTPVTPHASHVAVALARTQSLMREIRVLVLHAEIPDPVLEKKIRSKISRLAANPEAISVKVESGKVVLEGQAGRKEAQTLVDGVSSLRGVRVVENHLGSKAEEEADAAPVFIAPVTWGEKVGKLLGYPIPMVFVLTAGFFILAYLGIRGSKRWTEFAE